MKRVAAILLLLLYFVTSTGATLRYHYCMGKIASRSLWDVNEEKCGKCGMEKKETEYNSCCKDDLQWIKIEDDQKVNTARFEVSGLQFEQISFVVVNYCFFALKQHDQSTESKTPLRSWNLPTYLLNRVFLI